VMRRWSTALGHHSLVAWRSFDESFSGVRTACVERATKMFTRAAGAMLLFVFAIVNVSVTPPGLPAPPGLPGLPVQLAQLVRLGAGQEGLGNHLRAARRGEPAGVGVDLHERDAERHVERDARAPGERGPHELRP